MSLRGQALGLVAALMCSSAVAQAQGSADGASYQLASPEALFELRHMYAEQGLPPQPDQWDPWAEPDGTLRFLLREPRIAAADVAGIELYRSPAAPEGFACTIHLRPAAWPKVLALSEHPGDRTLVLLWRGKPLARGVSLLGRVAAAELTGASAMSVREGLIEALPREAERDGLADLEFQRWLAGQIQAGRQPLTARLLLASAYRQWRDCDAAEALLDGAPSAEPFTGGRYTLIHLFNQVADCFAEQEDYDRAEAVAQRLRGAPLTPTVGSEPELAAELQAWSELIRREIGQIRQANADPVSVASRYLFSQSGQLGRPTDCERAAGLVDRLIARAAEDPGLADRQLELIAACSLARGDRQAAVRILERVDASAIRDKDQLLARLRQIVDSGTMTASTPLPAWTSGL
jgi:hypothetical protein